MKLLPLTVKKAAKSRNTERQNRGRKNAAPDRHQNYEITEPKIQIVPGASSRIGVNNEKEVARYLSRYDGDTYR